MTAQRSPLAVSALASPLPRNLYLGTDWGALDCLGSIKGLGDFDEVLGQSEVLGLPWGNVRILSIVALIKSKQAMDRPRDLEAVQQLTEVRAKLESDSSP